MMVPTQPECCCCTHRELPTSLRLAAAWHAVTIRPSNGPELIELAYSHPHAVPLPPQAITLLKGRFWTPGTILKVAFRGGSPAINDRVLQYANLWSQWANISFADVGLNDDWDLCIGFDKLGYWSMIGTDSKSAQRTGEQSLNLQGFDSTPMPESEWMRVVPHEIGHALGAMHEQMRPEIVNRINREACYAYFARTQGWNRQMVDQQLLTPLDMSEMIASTVEETSIMEYQLPGSIMIDGRPVPGGDHITDLDGTTMAKVYPGKGPVHPQFKSFAEAV
jgi:hypothetical protein